jgi:hypothetical protein
MTIERQIINLAFFGHLFVCTLSLSLVTLGLHFLLSFNFLGTFPVLLEAGKMGQKYER